MSLLSAGKRNRLLN